MCRRAVESFGGDYCGGGGRGSFECWKTVVCQNGEAERYRHWSSGRCDVDLAMMGKDLRLFPCAGRLTACLPKKKVRRRFVV